MAVLEVRLYGDPVLRRRAAPVREVTPEIEGWLSDMVDTMHTEVGIGLAATQVGIELRMLVIDEGRGVGGRPYLNPVIVEQGGRAGGRGRVSVAARDLRRRARAQSGSWSRRWTGRAPPSGGAPTGLLARVLQHEIDHLDGILFIDRLDKVTRDRLKRQIKREGFPAETALAAGVRL